MKDEAVDIIKIDATANDWPKSLYDVSGFPTIYWKPKDKSEKPVRYNVSAIQIFIIIQMIFEINETLLAVLLKLSFSVSLLIFCKFCTLFNSFK